MIARSTGSTTISLGLVAIPVKLYSTVKQGGASFKLLHGTCKGCVKQQLVCPTDECVIEYSDTIKGFEVAPDKFVAFTKQELEALEAERREEVAIDAFVPASALDPIRIDKSTYLGPDKGGHKAYKMLRLEMAHAGVIAVGRYTARGKTRPVMLAPHDAVIVMHQLYFAPEVLPADVDLGNVTVNNTELRLMRKLVDQLRGDFDHAHYQDEYSDRVQRAADQKAAGGEVTASPEQPVAQVFELVEALKRSVESAPKAKGTVRKAVSDKPPRRRRTG